MHGRVTKAISKKKGRLRWGRIFGGPVKSDGGGGGSGSAAKGSKAGSDKSAVASRLPVKLEIASGTGDWVVAQALADVGAASWTAVELRHDRVYAIFSRMALQTVPNLCVLGGDAATIVGERMQSKTVAHAFINFPEPPSGWQGVEDASNALHLLTPDFFTSLHRVLEPGGHLTIFSDNGRYCRVLAATLDQLLAGGAPLFASQTLAHVSSYEQIGSVRLYHGVPGPECGHLKHETSYFDRMWEYRQGEETERFYMFLRRPE